MLLMRSAAAAPCSLTSVLLRRFTSSSASYAIRRHAVRALSSASSSARFTTWSPPTLSCSTRNRAFSAWASAPGLAGPTESPITQSLETKIKEQLEADTVTVIDTSGDGRHVCIDVVSKAFEGKSAVNRQRMVYKAIWEELQSTVHAVDQMTTKTPAEAAANNSSAGLIQPCIRVFFFSNNRKSMLALIDVLEHLVSNLKVSLPYACKEHAIPPFLDGRLWAVNVGRQHEVIRPCVHEILNRNGEGVIFAKMCRAPELES